MPVINPKKNGLTRLFPQFSPMKIKYKDIFEFDSFYEALYEYLKDQGWGAYDGDFVHLNWETFYMQKTSGGVTDHVIRWRCKKQSPDVPMMLYLDLDFQTIAMKGTEIVRGGQKVSADKGEFNLTITPFYETKYDKELKKHWLLKHFAGMFTNRIYGNVVPAIKAFYHEVYALNNFIKQWFKLKRYMPYEEKKSWYPSKAYPSHLKD